jgi:putative transposon-encoded protein
MTTKYNKISLDISFMRKVDLKPDEMSLSEEVELIFEKRVTPFGTSAKLDVPKKYRGWRAYVIIVKD